MLFWTSQCWGWHGHVPRRWSIMYCLKKTRYWWRHCWILLLQGAHSRDGIHSVLLSDWKAVESEDISQWMASRMSMRLAMSQSQNKRPPQGKDGGTKHSPANKRRQKRNLGSLFQQPGDGGGAANQASQNQLATPTNVRDCRRRGNRSPANSCF